MMPNHFLENIFSYDGNVFLAAILSLLLVVLFFLLLHIYAKWFLAQAHQRSSSSSMPFHHSHSSTFDDNTNNITSGSNNTISSSDSKGLETSLIASIPLFVYTSSVYKQGLECVICLNAFEESDVGRSLPNCGHAFHFECIDMWLHSHSNCPICRGPVISGENTVENNNNNGSRNNNSIEAAAAAASVELLEIVVVEVGDVSNCDHEVGINDSLSASGSVASSSSSSSSSSSLGCSLKRMLSWNRSDQCKAFSSSAAIHVN